MAIVTLIVGAVLFIVGIGGQVAVGRRFAKRSAPGDRRSARIAWTLAALVIGAWMVIASGATLLHAHAHAHPVTTTSDS